MLQCYRLLVVLSEGHDFCCCLQQDEMYLKFVRPGNKAAQSLSLDCQYDCIVGPHSLDASESFNRFDELLTRESDSVHDYRSIVSPSHTREHNNGK